MNLRDLKIGVIGLGYVGLPLACAISKKRRIIGFDINSDRIDELKKFYDHTNEVSSKDLRNSNLKFTFKENDLSELNCFIVTVPTPVNKLNKPDLKPLKSATRLVSKFLKKGSIVIYESTVYPGATEEVCAKIIEQQTGMILNKDFYLGYSPERINPGDKKHTITKIKKITSGSNAYSSELVNSLYSSFIKAGTYSSSSIRVAEAAKVIENTQRDVNIALINELSMLFNKMQIDTSEVLKAANTKWNFLNFSPGLVGGHCIGVDPYYLTYKAKKVGFDPKMILAGRKINNGMTGYIIQKVRSLLKENSKEMSSSNILVLGATFKENCPDIRNSKSLELSFELQKQSHQLDLYDPNITKDAIIELADLNLVKLPKRKHYDCIILAVSHKVFFELGIKNIRACLKDSNSILLDLKSMFPAVYSDFRL